MRWTPADIKTTLQETAFIDTAIIPVISLSWGMEAMGQAIASEYIHKFSEEMERMYKGRMLLLPHLAYMMGNETALLSLMKQLETDLTGEGIQYIFYLTCEINVKNIASDIVGDVIWLPPIPLETMEVQQQRETLATQIKAMMAMVEAQWKTKKITQV